MRANTIRTLVTLAFVALLGLPGLARADVPITGTVGEISPGAWFIPAIYGNGTSYFIRFKMTDLNQTKTCTGGANSQGGSGYAFISADVGTGNRWYREWFAMLLVSKKGSPITCMINDTTVCNVSMCTLP